MQVNVIGLGYIGLPTAAVLAEHGIDVRGVDINAAVIATLNRSGIPINEPGLRDSVRTQMTEGRLRFSAVPDYADAYIIAVQTPVGPDRSPDLSYVHAAVDSIIPYLREGNLVVVESTIPPGTVNRHIVPQLKQTGLDIGRQLFVAYSPERVYPGNVWSELVGNDRIIGGVNEESAREAAKLYGRFVKGSIHLTDSATAEMVKLMENTSRDVNIAFANEMARISESAGINVWEAIRLANTHPRVRILQPGPGVGGHCIAVDPWFIVDSAHGDAPLTLLARTINDHTPARIVRMIESLVAGIDTPVLTLLGLAYKGNSDDTRGSPSVAILQALLSKGYAVNVFDPYTGNAYGNKSSVYEAAERSDCLILLTDHAVFRELDYTRIAAGMNTRQFLDTRNALDPADLEIHGFACYRIGTPGINRTRSREADDH
ncbi:MAG: UDP-N-acetyl-D-mannosamine dehydrogenase [Paenibacillus sp.]|uniref:nucleotide sugar dehydrogenase n=1 Tax=Paenibacillus sp. GCM10012303 TaxID=3317340 RepID=UPI0029EF17B9|nr:UDP-N-acetyl-D-mannosamine dehydrogenase [Paenibacillus sp.]